MLKIDTNKGRTMVEGYGSAYEIMKDTVLAVRSVMTLLIQNQNEEIGHKAFVDFCDAFNPGGSLDWDSIVENAKNQRL